MDLFFFALGLAFVDGALEKVWSETDVKLEHVYPY